MKFIRRDFKPINWISVAGILMIGGVGTRVILNNKDEWTSYTLAYLILSLINFYSIYNNMCIARQIRLLEELEKESKLNRKMRK